MRMGVNLVEQNSGYPWPLFVRTVLLLVSFLFLGIVDVLRGPTLLDLKDLYNTSISKISFIFMLTSIGSIVGCFVVGLTMDKFKRLRYLVIGLLLIIYGSANCLFPYYPSLALLYTGAFFSGFGGGSVDAGCQVLLLDIWSGRNSGPYMHALHFTFGLGAFFSPLIAKPFLVNVENMEESARSNYNGSNYDRALKNTTEMTAVDNRQLILSEMWNIRVLYPMMSVVPVLLSLGYICYFLVDWRCNKGSNSDDTDKKEIKPDSDKGDKVSGKKLLVLCITMIFFFLYVGLEVAFGTYLTTFAVKSRLGLSRGEGSYLTSVFWGTFAAMRGVAVPAAIFLKPELIMIISFTCCLVGSTILSILGDTYVIALYVCSGVMGVGMASIYATGMLWLKRYVNITYRVGSALAISASLGAKIFPVLVGQTVEETPMSFMYLVLAVSTGCTLLFCINSLIARTIVTSSDLPQGKQTGDEMNILNPPLDKGHHGVISDGEET